MGVATSAASRWLGCRRRCGRRQHNSCFRLFRPNSLNKPKKTGSQQTGRDARLRPVRNESSGSSARAAGLVG